VHERVGIAGPAAVIALGVNPERLRHLPGSMRFVVDRKRLP
jgi:hypothetical protein